MSTMLPPLILELRAHAGQLKAELAGVEKEIDHLDKKSGGMTGFQKGFNRAAMAGKYLAGGIAAAATVVGYESVKMAASFQQASLHLVTDAGESQKNLKMVQQGMLNLSASTGIGASEIAKGMYLVESAGYHGAAGLKVMQAAAEGAKIGGADLATVSDALTTAMTDYHFPASQAALVTSKLIATVGQGKTTMEALAGSLHNVLPTAASLGIQFQQVTGAMATMTAEGISADVASQNLNHAIVSLANPTQVQTKEMAAMGLNSTKVAQQLGKKGLTGTLSDLVTAIDSHMGKSGMVLQNAFTHSQLAAQSASTEFKGLGSQAQKLASQYMHGSLSLKQWTADTKALSPVQGNLAHEWAASYMASQKFADTLTSNQGVYQTFTGALAKMTGGQQGLSVALHLVGKETKGSQSNLAMFENNVQVIGKASTESGNHVRGWAETQKLLIVQLDQAKASIEKMGIQIGSALIPYVSKALKGSEAFVGYLAAHKGVLITLASVIGGVVTLAITAYVAALAKAGVDSVVQFAKMSAAAVKWIVAQVASVSESLALWSMYAVEWVAKQATSIAESVALWAMYAVQWVARQASSIATSVALWGAYAVEWVAGQAASVGQSVALWAMYAGEWIAKQATAIAGAIARWVAFGAQWVAVQSVALAKWVAGAARATGEWLATQSVAFAQAAARGALYVGAMVVQGAAASGVWVASTARVVAALAVQGAALVAQKAIMIASAIATGVVTAAQWAWNVAMDANPIGIIILAIAALIAIIILVATHWKQITAFLTTAWQNVSTVFQTVGRTLAAWWRDLWDSQIGQTVRAAFQPAITWAVSTFRSMVGFFQSVGADIRAVWNGIWAGLANVVQQQFGTVLSIIHGTMSAITGAINGAIGGINSVTSLGAGIGINLPKIPSLPHFDVGGTIPGPIGAPILMVGHGGEEVLSNAMLAGQQPIPPRAREAIAAGPSSSSVASSSAAGVTQNIYVTSQTNATPQQIASSVGWELRRLA